MKSRIRLALLPCVLTCLFVACDNRTAPPAESSLGPTLVELCRKHSTDKCAYHHNYVELYDLFFQPLRSQAEKVLEIGIAKGESLRMWEEYFPVANIFGIDINEAAQSETERIHTFVADQANREQLGQFVDERGSGFDIVIDDGGHTMEQQQVSFGFFFPHLRSGGVYVLEDVHTSFPDLYPGYGVNEDAGNSTFDMITNFVREGSFTSDYLSSSELEELNSQVDHCLYSYRPNKFHSDFFLCYKK